MLNSRSWLPKMAARRHPAEAHLNLKLKRPCSPSRICLIGVYLTSVPLMGVHLKGVHLTGVHLMGVHLVSMCLIDVHLMSVYLIGVYLIYTHVSHFLRASQESLAGGELAFVPLWRCGYGWYGCVTGVPSLKKIVTGNMSDHSIYLRVSGVYVHEKCCLGTPYLCGCDCWPVG
jgi:hypothetical protein